MKLWRKLIGWCVPSTALTGWIVPLRRVDALKDRIPVTMPENLFLGSIGQFTGLALIVTPRAPEGGFIRSGDQIVVNRLSWEGGLAPWQP